MAEIFGRLVGYAVQVNCRGYEKGLAAAFDWTTDEGSHPVMFEGLGSENMAVDADGVSTIVANVQ